jgi:hypothetical protein
MIFGNAVARHNKPYDRLAEECVERRLLIVGVVSGGTSEGHARTTCLVIGRSAHVEQDCRTTRLPLRPPRSLWPRPRVIQSVDLKADQSSKRSHTQALPNQTAAGSRPAGDDQIGLRLDQFGSKLRQPFISHLRGLAIDHDRAALNPPELPQLIEPSLRERSLPSCVERVDACSSAGS